LGPKRTFNNPQKPELTLSQLSVFAASEGRHIVEPNKSLGSEMKKLAVLLLALALPVTSVAAAEAANPLYDFLKAADDGNLAVMQEMLKDDVGVLAGGKQSPAEFFKRLENCYLRRVYSDGYKPGTVIATWMCSVPADTGESRVVVVNVANTNSGLHLSDLFETHNKRPAPPRDGPALK